MHDLSSFEPKIRELLRSILSASHLELNFSLHHHPGATPALTIVFTGPDSSLLTARNGELLRAIEHLSAKMCGLDPSEHDLLSVDADRFKEKRELALREAAEAAAQKVRDTGRPYTFQPMSSHERRRLHLALNDSGLQTASTGEGVQRAVVLYPPRASASA